MAQNQTFEPFTTYAFGRPLGYDEFNHITQVDNDTVVVTPRFNTTGKRELKIGVLLPFSQKDDNFTAEIVWGGSSAIRLAVNQINQNNLISGAYISLIQKDSFPTGIAHQSAVTDAVYASVTLLQQGVIGVIGDVSSSWTSLSALMTSTLEIPQCSFTASAVAFSDKTQYKYFFRTVPTEVIVADVMFAFAANQGWGKVAIVYTDDALGQQFYQRAIIQANLKNLHVIHYQPFPDAGTPNDMDQLLYNVTTTGARIIVVAVTGDSQNALMIHAAQSGYLSDTYVWLLMGDGSQLPKAVQTYNDDIVMNNKNGSILSFNSTFTGVFAFDNWLFLYDYPPFEAFLDDWSRLSPVAYPFAGRRNISTNEGLAYSCMMVMAQGFRNTISHIGNYTYGLEQLATGGLGDSLTPPAFNVGYVGPEGPMTYDSNGDLTAGNYIVYNFQHGIRQTIGTSMAGRLNLTGTPMYHDGTSKPPLDFPPSLSLNPDFSSPIAHVILAVSALGVLFSLGMFILVLIFRKHEVFKAASPLFCCLELVGFILTYLSVTLLIGNPTTVTCILTPLAFNLGFLLVLSNLIAKNYRIYRIFNNVYITRTVITDSQLIRTVSLVVGVDMVILAIGMIISTPAPLKVDVSFSNHYWTCQTRQGPRLAFMILLSIYAAGLLLFATFLAYKTRLAGRHYTRYSECKQMGLSVYNILFSSLVGFAIIVNPMGDYYTKYYISVITVLWATSFSLLVLFLPKLHAFVSQWRREEKAKRKDGDMASPRLQLYNMYRSSTAVVGGMQQPQQHDSQQETAEILSLDRMLGSDLPVMTSSCDATPGKASMVSLTTQCPKESGSCIEVHEGRMPIRKVFRYFPYLAQWEMQHIMVFPWLGYFSHFSERAKTGTVMSYSQATVHSAQLEDYVLKVHGQGLYDMYIQVSSLAAMETWQRCFNRRLQQESLFFQQPTHSSSTPPPTAPAETGSTEDIASVADGQEPSRPSKPNDSLAMLNLSQDHLLVRHESEHTLDTLGNSNLTLPHYPVTRRSSKDPSTFN
ncbi:uncharacterized protein BYT42DRAFT_605670 [Radiomyces spectabilis]|uniref:uncharacterized protein n=1 Tax=Radiomyces spectabilis TaxID=64574 RepID=UPI00221E4E95|nr:uncharacterized protein BYT42DRAFT_605670 [Radiomyces spectabilis]KAI8376578.1 hypothetical protein BYT42DRAFT_605670 [Radiomyces spectabilis]